MKSQKKQSNLEYPPIEESGRTVLIRGPNGEIILSSSNEKDSIEKMAVLALEQYNKQGGATHNRPEYIQ